MNNSDHWEADVRAGDLSTTGDDAGVTTQEDVGRAAGAGMRGSACRGHQVRQAAEIPWPESRFLRWRTPGAVLAASRWRHDDLDHPGRILGRVRGATDGW
jgi:hypothetical protein